MTPSRAESSRLDAPEMSPTLMSYALIEAGIDVSDEREVIMHLVAAGFTSPAINTHLDTAVDLVRAHRAASPLLDVA